MRIKDEEIKEMLSKDELADVEMICIIQRYIYDKKNVEVKINRPRHDMDVYLMKHMFGVASEYYKEKWK